MKLRFTDLAVKKLPHPTSGQKSYWDETTPGFGLRCSTKSKSFMVMYGEKRRRKMLGRYPNISLSDARVLAKRELLAAHESQNVTHDVDFSHAVSIYLLDCEGRLRSSTVSEYRLYLEGLDYTGKLSELSRNQILKSFNKWPHSPSMHNHAFTAVKVFLNWAVQQEFVALNPIGPLKRPHSAPARDNVLDDGHLIQLLHYTKENPSRYNNIITLLVLTGQRRGEIAGLQWSEIDGDVLQFLPSRTKNKKTHAIPLGRQALELIETSTGSEMYVFGTPMHNVPFSGWSKAKARLNAQLGFSDFTLHDLRRTFSTIHAKIGTPIHVTEKLLNHQSGAISGVAAVYNRQSYMEEMRTAVSNYEAYLEKRINS